MVDATTTEAQVIPSCAWCRLPITGEPHHIYVLGKPVAAFCAVCHSSGYQAATGLMALGNAMLATRKRKTNG